MEMTFGKIVVRIAMAISCFSAVACSSVPYRTAIYDKIGFFTPENKPEHYQAQNPNQDFAFVSVNDRDDGGSGESWANLRTELKIREMGARANYNGVILGPLVHQTVMVGYENVTYYYRYFLLINYDQEKYQAPLTEYQKSRLIKK